MTQNEFESMAVEKHERLFYSVAFKWLREHNFTNTEDFIPEAVQGARIGYLLYLRKIGATTNEELTEERKEKAWWYMYAEIYKAVMSLCPRSAFGGGRNIWNETRISVCSVEVIVKSETAATAAADVFETEMLTKVAIDQIMLSRHSVEGDILRLLKQGMNFTFIAKELKMSRQTLRTHITHIRKILTEALEE